MVAVGPQKTYAKLESGQILVLYDVHLLASVS
jgi:hypothetical protein